MKTERVSGSCLCGDVRYDVALGDIGVITTCYCSRCRKSHGAERRLRARVKRGSFRWLSGEQGLARFSLSDRRDKLFCSRCGTPIVNVDADDSETVGLAIASLDEDPGSRNVLHLFAASRPEWIEIRDDLPAFDTAPDVVGTLVEVRPGTVVVAPDGSDSPLTLRAENGSDFERGTRVRAHLAHAATRHVLYPAS